MVTGLLVIIGSLLFLGISLFLYTTRNSRYDETHTIFFLIGLFGMILGLMLCWR